MPKVLIGSRECAQVEDRFADVLAAAGLDFCYPPTAEVNQLTEAELIDTLHGVVATVAGSEPYTPRVFAAHPQLKVIARVGVGYDAVHLPAATASGVCVTIAPNTNHGSVAEHTFALMLGFTRHLPVRHATIAAGGWPRHMSQPLRGRTLGLAGLGRIGKAVAVRAAAFEMKVIAFDPLLDAGFCGTHGITTVPFDHLLAASDFLSLHLPLTPETRHTMNRDTLAKMEPGAVLVNTSRGGLVREVDLIEALRGSTLAGAALDVFEQEPLPVDSPLRAMPNVVLTPHAAGVDIQSLGDMARSAAEAVAALKRGDWPAEKVVNAEVRGVFQW
ncbi:MAG TPA: phosphoglycerate dehydrogenase [Gemmataceae bacterium]|nr:phosphoglycerate dehydrogenase [Gemmataceae bacterium]